MKRLSTGLVMEAFSAGPALATTKEPYDPNPTLRTFLDTTALLMSCLGLTMRFGRIG